MPAPRQLHRLAQRRQLARLLAQAHLVDDLPGVLDAQGRVHTGPRSGPEVSQQPGDARVELRVRAAHPVEERARAAQHARQLLVELGDLEGVIGAEVLHRALGAGAAACPDLALLVARADEEGEALLGGEHRHRLRLLEAGEEEEVAVGAIGMLDVVVARGHRRRGKDSQRRPRRQLAHAAQHLLAARGVDRLVEGGSDGHGLTCNRTFRGAGGCGAGSR